MKKFFVSVIFLLTLICGIYFLNLYNLVNFYISGKSLTVEAAVLDENFTDIKSAMVEQNMEHYSVYVNNNFTISFDTYEEAMHFVSDKKKASIIEDSTNKTVWDNYPNYVVKLGKTPSEFSDFNAALSFARLNENSKIFYKKDEHLIWESDFVIADSVFIDAPLIKQLPELPRGCEVTSLGMLLAYNNIYVDKMELATNVRKNPNTYAMSDGIKYFGNPNNGFVGDMYSYATPGLGVYSRPIYELLKEYMPNSAVNYTGSNFEDLYYSLNNGQPVWVIINTTYNTLPDSRFETWHTEDGDMKITYSEHSVLVVGYDDTYVYFNDPLGRQDRAPKEGFINAWIQMGRHAVSVTPNILEDEG